MNDTKSLWQAFERARAAADPQGMQRPLLAIVALDPTQAFAWYQLSMLALSEDRLLEALGHASTAAEATISHRRWRALPYVAMQLLRLDELELLQRLGESIDLDDPLALVHAPTLGQCLWLAAEHARALVLLDDAERRLPVSHLLAFLKGNVFRSLGRADEATAQLERSIRLKADFPDAHWILASHSPADDGRRVERIQAAMQRHPAGSEANVALGYALFKELDYAGRHVEAWHALASAMAAKRSHLAFDSAGEAATFDELLAEVAEMGDPGPQPAHGTPVPLFIVGMPRTGTTLLERIIGNHARIATVGESNALRMSVARAADRLPPVFPDAASLRQRRHADPRMIADRYLKVTRSRARMPSATHIIDKNPANIHHAAVILRAMPNARILCLDRDPMDACFSNLKEWFSEDNYGYSYDLQDVASHYHGFKRLSERLQRQHPDSFMRVPYEALVAQPGRVMQDIAGFCGFDFDHASLDLSRNHAPVSTASSSQVRDVIRASHVGGWRPYATWLQPLMEALRLSAEAPC